MIKCFSFLMLFFSFIAFSQVDDEDSTRNKNRVLDTLAIKQSTTENEVYEEIQKANTVKIERKFNPTKAGLYSAVLPGLGQYYNKKYWKIPVVLGAIGTGVGFTIYYQNQYERYRNAFVAELNGLEHEFSDRPTITKEALGRAQDNMKRYRDYAIAITSLVYILNIIDAVVDAHLYQGRNDPDLAIRPTIIYNNFDHQSAKAGLSFNFKF